VEEFDGIMYRLWVNLDHFSVRNGDKPSAVPFPVAVFVSCQYSPFYIFIATAVSEHHRPLFPTGTAYLQYPKA